MIATGRYLISFHAGRHDAGVAAVERLASVKVTDARELGLSASATPASPDHVGLHALGLAVLSIDEPDLATRVQDLDDVRHVEPEHWAYVVGEFERGFLAGASAAFASLRETATLIPIAKPIVASFDEGTITWGLQAIGVPNSKFNGEGINVAVLDTGIDLQHTDFVNRMAIVQQSFVEGVSSVQDGHGHGTHTAGTIWGPTTPSSGPRYGIAPRAQLYIGKVMADDGSGRDGDILAGINWAVTKHCDIIYMSIGASVSPGGQPSVAYEQAISQSFAAECAVFIAAGNDSRRPTQISPVSQPANSPSAVAIAAVDDTNTVADFSNGKVGSGKEPDIAGPGVQIYSAAPTPRLHQLLSGTSMATPHIAGVAALVGQETGKRGRDLVNEVLKRARALTVSVSDVGAGLVQVG